MKRKQCTIEGCKNPVWANGLCTTHTSKKPLKSKRMRLPRKRKSNHKSLLSAVKDKQGDMLKRFKVFTEIWNTRPRKSEVSGISLGNEILSVYFHHILPKSKYPEYELDPENIILLTLDEHNNVENDIYKYDEVNKRREQLKIKYDI